MNLRQLRSFVAVVEEESFTRAGAVTYTSQPTISSHIRALEQELGVCLLRRNTKTTQLTSEGQDLYAFACTVLQLQEQMVRRWKEKHTHVLNIGASTLPATYILPQILPQYRLQEPGAYFCLHQGDSQEVIQGIQQGLYDLGLIGMPCVQEGMHCEPFCQDRMVVITPVEETFFPFLESETVDWEALFRHPVVLRERGSGTRKWASELLETLGLAEGELDVSARSNDPESIKQLVAHGVGISIVSEIAARDFVQAHRLLQIPVPDQLGSRALYMIYSETLAPTHPVWALIQFIRKQWCIAEA